VAECRFPDGVGIGLRRAHLSALLLDQVRRWPSVRIVTGTRAELRRHASGVDVTIGQTHIRPRLVMAADGLASRTRAAAGIATRVGPTRRWGMRQHFDCAPWTRSVDVHFGHGFEAYVTPLDAGVNVAILWDPARVAVPRGDSAVVEMAGRLPALAFRLAGATPLDRVGASGPFRRQTASSVSDGVLLIGDAAGYVDALTGEGVGLALLHAEAIEQAVVPYLLGSAGRGPIPARALAPFAAAVGQRSRPHRQLTELLLRVSAHPALVEIAIAALRASPGLFAHCLRVNMGERRLWALPRPSSARPLRAATW
jgi:2-polyprenyl-6-methoxyphenol hydroxylase-like FAD-dependent oxidoreductase